MQGRAPCPSANTTKPRLHSQEDGAFFLIHNLFTNYLSSHRKKLTYLNSPSIHVSLVLLYLRKHDAQDAVLDLR